MDRIERPAKFAAIAHLRLDPVTQQQVERFVSTKPGGRERAMSKPQAMEHHPGDGFPRGDLLWLIRHDTGVDHADESQVLYHMSHEPEVIQAFNTDRFHLALLESGGIIRRRMQRRVKGFFSFCTRSMSGKATGVKNIV
jgi:hypothetical protein